jgi:hypothetical protein
MSIREFSLMVLGTISQKRQFRLSMEQDTLIFSSKVDVSQKQW